MKRRTIYWIIGTATLLILTGLAVLAVRLIDSQKVRNKTYVDKNGQTWTHVETSVDLIHAGELPQSLPTASGLIIEIIDNRMPITSLERMFTTDAQGNRTADSRLWQEMLDNPITDAEIVVTKDTKIYMDVTDMDAAISGGTTQQILEQIDFEEIQPKGTVTVWGEKHGERIVAQVILYRPH